MHPDNVKSLKKKKKLRYYILGRHTQGRESGHLEVVGSLPSLACSQKGGSSSYKRTAVVVALSMVSFGFGVPLA